MHGESGLDGFAFPEPSIRAQSGHAVDFIIDTVMSQNDVILVATAPLTNIAMAIRREPRLVGRLQEISLMGGSITAGNWTAAAEYNIWADPESADIVFRSSIPKRMVGLNLTRQAVATKIRVERIRNLGNKTGRAIAALISWFSVEGYKMDGQKDAFLYDPRAVAWLILPELVRAQPLHVVIELRGQYTRGMTVCDYRCLTGTESIIDVTDIITPIRQGEPPNVNVATRINSDEFYELITSTLKLYP